ncbi:MAG TPA: redox-sensing transcriptional repressor Rex [Spirochaetia bacterium]|nr:redox-sensing transcriptional repressor Rex [Spirochaetia bacterium]
MRSSKLASMPTIKRLPGYLHIIEAARREGKEFISGTVIADELELEPIQVRKDLAVTGIVGKPRIGFPVEKLIEAINGFLQWNQVHNAVVVGAGNLGTALSGYPEFRRHGLNIVAALDTDSSKIDRQINKVPVYAMDDMKRCIDEHHADLAILTVPSPAAQETAELLIEAGIRAIWNFTNVKLKVPSGVMVQKEDLSSGYAVLSVKMGRRNHH